MLHCIITNGKAYLTICAINWLLFTDTAVILFGYIGRKKLGKILKKFEQPPFYPTAQRGDEKEESRITDAWLSFFKKQTVLLTSGSLLIIFYRLFYTLTRRYIYSEWILPWSPMTMINTSCSPNYEILWLYQNTVYLYYCFTSIPLILITVGSLSFLSVQFQILHRYLKRILQISRQNGSSNCDLDAKEVKWHHLKWHIKQAVTYHLEISKAIQEVNGIFNGAFLCVCVLTLMLICFDIYQASMLPHFNLKIVYLLAEVLTVFSPTAAYCYYGERIAHESQMISEVAYEIDFVGTDVRFQKSLMMIIKQSQKPLRIKAGNMIEASLAVVVWILRTSFSAYMMLRTINMPKQ